MFVVVTRSTFTPDIEKDVLALAEQSVPVAKAQPGFVDMVVHINHDRTQLMTYWCWARREDHENCMASEDWQDYMPGWERLIASGKLQFDMDTYDVLAKAS